MRKNQVILLMITDNEKWHYLAVKKLSALFRGINYEKKEIIPLTNEENQSHHNQNNCDIC